MLWHNSPVIYDAPPPAERRGDVFPERLVLERPLPLKLSRPSAIALGAASILTLIVAFVIFLALQQWTGRSTTPAAAALLRVDLIEGAVPIIAYSFGAIAFVFLVLRRPTRIWVVTSLIALASGAATAVLVLWYFSANDTFGVQLSTTTSVWGIVTFAAVAFALSNLWRSRPARKLVAIASIVFFVSAGFVGVNADFGLDRTPADLAGISTQPTLSIPVATVKPTPTPTLLAGGALWANWHAPVGMPTGGQQGQVIIPNTVSGFVARAAGLYLPPAALVPNPPALPFVIMMMGQPGNPEPIYTANILDPMAAAHAGLAPIVLVVDQIGNPSIDPLCLDTARYGKAETYLTQDVVPWARTHLHILQDPAHWTVAGYSNGGECALSLGVKFPQVWGNVLDISGEEYPGADRAVATRAAAFGGSQAAYDAQKPLGLLAGHSYQDTVAIVTVGSNDYGYRQQAMRVAAATKAAGWKTTYFEVLNGGHVLGALYGGLQEGYSVLFPRLGLSQ